MLAIADLIPLPCSPDLIESGITRACSSFAGIGFRPGASVVHRLRKIVIDVAVELAFRRYLTAEGVPFGAHGTAPFTDPGQFDVSLGGHSCSLVGTFISHRRDISLVQRNRSLLLQAPAAIPLDEFTAREGRPDDIQLFIFILGLTAASHQDVDKAQSAGQPLGLVHPLPDPWSHPAAWTRLENLVMKSESDQPVEVEITGQDAERNIITCMLELPSRLRMPVPGEFHSVLCLRPRQLPAARVGIHTPVLGEAHIVSPFDWINLWIYGMELLLSGWLTRENYRRKAVVLNPGKRTMFATRINEKSLFVPVGDLNPLVPLLRRVRDWAAVGQEQGKTPGNP